MEEIRSNDQRIRQFPLSLRLEGREREKKKKGKGREERIARDSTDLVCALPRESSRTHLAVCILVSHGVLALLSFLSARCH